MAHVVLPAIPVPDELHLAVDRDRNPATESYDRGVLAVFAHSVATDRAADRGTTTRSMSRQTLIADEREDRAVVQIDAAEGFANRLSVIQQRARRPRFSSLAPTGVRALAMSAANGIWAETVRRISSPGSVWKLLEVAQDGAELNLVIDPAPEMWRTRAAMPLGPRPHPEVVVVDGLGSVPRVWRRAARDLILQPPLTRGTRAQPSGRAGRAGRTIILDDRQIQT